ncbi:uncharacterized protein YbjT (DUF2867 family) [Herbihabitans rhizosphaerae]|uniref:Uncharacterized protein YbjT (DUF2867 family) n=1 Tax=Herbihabitans rhizosphaerae TaxID=1872711 RepID=A0A4Q7KC97_9PSEU|nr:NAD(P)H-binding protein [Herbihabitans rhizosphaerae]RZS29468.1 uncharacterized protein YbjT (DUF2867 family) [Herbihabitans rhizosphaerae]
MTILVTGARGAIARCVVDTLHAAGAPVRAASRKPEDTTAPDGVDVVDFDPARPDTLAPAMDGVHTLFVYAEPNGIDDVLTTARTAGIEHIVLLSSLAAATPEMLDNPIAEHHLGAERPIAASGIPWTFVRPGMFATNALWWAPSIRATGTVALYHPDAHVTPTHERDIADVAVHAITQPGQYGKAYLMNGPESLTQRQQVELIAAASGREITIDELTRERAAERLPEAVLDLVEQTDDVPQPTGPTIEEIIGRAPRTFATWARDHAHEYLSASPKL